MSCNENNRGLRSLERVKVCLSAAGCPIQMSLSKLVKANLLMSPIIKNIYNFPVCYNTVFHNNNNNDKTWINDSTELTFIFQMH